MNHIIRFSQKNIKNYAFRPFSGSDENVLQICVRKIKFALNPDDLQVTSSNDDPNGSHVRF